MRISAILLAIAFATGTLSGHAGNTSNSGLSPVLVELFTSEGCSSCPPADAFLQRLDTIQPIPGAQLIVLSEHVDYFNHDGWKDPYSSSLITERQNGYIQALGLKTAYTPQIIVDGTEVLHLSDQQQMTRVFEQAAATPKIHINIGPVTMDAKDPTGLRTHLEINSDDEHSANIYLAVALDHVTSHVLRGENSGRDLTNVAVLQSLTKVGKLKKHKGFNQDVHVKLNPGTDLKDTRIIVFLQGGGQGKILGAAMQKNAGSI